VTYEYRFKDCAAATTATTERNATTAYRRTFVINDALAVLAVVGMRPEGVGESRPHLTLVVANKEPVVASNVEYHCHGD